MNATRERLNELTRENIALKQSLKRALTLNDVLAEQLTELQRATRPC